MTRKLIIDGNAVYEIDEECMLKNRVEDNDRKKDKREEDRHEYRKKGNQENMQEHDRLR